MHLQEAIALIHNSYLSATGPVTWADLGCGTGLFTHALASLLPAGSLIYAIDTDRASLTGIADHNNVVIEKVRQDFVQDEWPFETLDGILMANSLHYVKDKSAFIKKANHHLTESGCFLLVEYDTDTPNPWVPYPLSYNSLKQLFEKAGYRSVEKLAEKPSIYGRAKLYSAYITHKT